MDTDSGAVMTAPFYWLPGMVPGCHQEAEFALSQLEI